MNYYWELLQHDGTVSLISPDSADTVKRRWNAGEPIHLANMSIPANQIKRFAITDKPFTDQKLIEQVAQAFDEPMFEKSATRYGYEDVSILCRWVKKTISTDRWNKYYSAILGYRRLSEDSNMVTIAFKLPVHVKTDSVDDCSIDEVKQLEKHT